MEREYKTVFYLDDKEQAKFDKWYLEVRKQVCEEQMQEYRQRIANDGDALFPKEYYESQLRIMESSYNEGRYYPNEGAIGGGLTYSFTPTGLGTILTCRYFSHKIDLTDYDSW